MGWLAVLVRSLGVFMGEMISESRRFSVALVDDDARYGDQVAGFFQGAAGFQWLGVVHTGADALRLLPVWDPDIILLDVSLPDRCGVELVGELRRLLPEVEIMMLTVARDPERIFQSVSLGARGYLTKEASGPQLLEAAEALGKGGSPMWPSIARKLLDGLFSDQGPKPTAKLTAREEEILKLVAGGGQNKEVAMALGISAETVRAHLYNIYRKLEVKTRAQAVRKAWPRLFSFGGGQAGPE